MKSFHGSDEISIGNISARLEVSTTSQTDQDAYAPVLEAVAFLFDVTPEPHLKKLLDG
jgi:hypothetical protein